MNSCHHIGWFHLSGRDNLYVHHTYRARNITQEMTHPETQYPSLIFFIGSDYKDSALREIFPNNNVRRGHRNGIVNLRLDSATISSDLPLLFADGDPKSPIPGQFGTTPCHEQMTVPLHWKSDKHCITYDLYARLAGPFTDVVCIFADDFDGLDGVASFLIHWVKMGSPSTLHLAVRPRVVIVTREEVAATYDVLQMESLRHRLDEESSGRREEVFSSISVLQLAGDHVSPLARHRRLREVLMVEVDEVRKNRIHHRAFFSAIHFEAFFRRAFHHVASSVTEPFDFVASTRENNEIRDEYVDHIKNFIGLAKEYFVSYQDQTSFLASSILMDAYPPGMHSKFV